MIKAIIFDLDGVIVSTDELHYLAWKQMADSEGIYFDRNINNRLRGVSRMASLEIILERATKRYSEEQKLAMAEQKNEIYKNLLLNLTPDDRLPGITETLAKLRERGYKLAIGSSSKNTPAILRQIGLGDYFDAVSDGNNISHSKPDPEVFLKAAQMLGISPENCAIVEDAEAGIEAGLRAEMTTFAVGDATKCQKSTYSLTSFSEILEILK
ncbi:MAG: beta-phosphoglucomutase [Eubacteriales bacterium]